MRGDSSSVDKIIGGKETKREVLVQVAENDILVEKSFQRKVGTNWNQPERLQLTSPFSFCPAVSLT